LFETIRVYKLTLNSPPLTPPAAQKSAASIDLAAVSVRPSGYLWRAQYSIYGALILLAWVALLPFFLLAYYWGLIGVVFTFCVGLAIHKSWRTKNAAPIQFEIKQNIWQLTTESGTCAVTLRDNVLLWSWVIVISLRENITGKSHDIIILSDSLTKEDWRRLRVWLLTCL
jgi:hypothetical protein